MQSQNIFDEEAAEPQRSERLAEERKISSSLMMTWHETLLSVKENARIYVKQHLASA